MLDVFKKLGSFLENPNNNQLFSDSESEGIAGTEPIMTWDKYLLKYVFVDTTKDNM